MRRARIIRQLVEAGKILACRFQFLASGDFHCPPDLPGDRLRFSNPIIGPGSPLGKSPGLIRLAARKRDIFPIPGKPEFDVLESRQRKHGGPFAEPAIPKKVRHPLHSDSFARQPWGFRYCRADLQYSDQSFDR